MNIKTTFSVIIPTYDRNDLLAKCLNCLAPSVQTLPADQYEVIVTDDGSQTTAEEMIRQQYPWAKWVAGPRKGPAANRNNGAKYAQGKWLAFTDDDCLPDPQWLEVYAKATVAEPSCLVFEGRTYVDRPKKTLSEISPVNETGGYLWSCNFAIQLQLFQSLGGFDERFPYAAMEDVDLRLRLTKIERKFIFVNLASVCHPWRTKGGWRKLKQHQESVLIYLYIHPEELVNINFKTYLKNNLYSFIKFTIPESLIFKGHGIKEAFLEHIANFHMAFRLYKQFHFNTNKIN
ncbi:glycosyltransferase [Tolypothrix sp. FACHB-123]|uniref:glycosyltransferase family 2 protein n=1 Tax=Tolypothrix sp. FACHB-123 TaxID=2692868 RepID=UPI0016854230|nr:glycosyltransferase [Tolypothrix sp. FACHB-123]MBD2358440.1 glycosyltransferase [Tolypothrix sp. FACHB-123]